MLKTKMCNENDFVWIYSFFKGPYKKYVVLLVAKD